MIGFFTENGPYNYIYNTSSFNNRFAFDTNEQSWNNFANVMYVDQPIGTGFSFTSFFRHRFMESQIAMDFQVFLREFMKVYPEYYQRPIYLIGESYAGHYIPSIASHIYHYPETGIVLAGVAIGNGWVDPFYQYASYARYAAINNLISVGHEYVLYVLFQICQFFSVVRIPFITDGICTLSGITIATPGYPEFNIYDIREKCVRFGLCYPDNHLWEVLNSFEYRDLMNLPIREGTKWEECNWLTHLFLLFDFNANWGYTLAPLLDKGLPVLIYTGDQDYIANWVGVGDWTDGLVWEGQNEFQFSRTREWRPKQDQKYTGGLVKQFMNFSVIRIREAGHMVPMDQPVRAHDLIKEWIETGTVKPYEFDWEPIIHIPDFEDPVEDKPSKDEDEPVEEPADDTPVDEDEDETPVDEDETPAKEDDEDTPADEDDTPADEDEDKTPAEDKDTKSVDDDEDEKSTDDEAKTPKDTEPEDDEPVFRQDDEEVDTQ